MRRDTTVCDPRLGFGVLRLSHRAYRRQRCPPEEGPALRAECEARGIQCVYLLVDASDIESINILQQMGALFTDTRITFGTAPGGPLETASHGGTTRVRPATGADVAALTQMASVRHRGTRFHADRHFAPERCDRLYEVWIENSCRGYADVVLVAEDERGRLAGYVSCHRTPAIAVTSACSPSASRRRDAGSAAR